MALDEKEDETREESMEYDEVFPDNQRDEQVDSMIELEEVDEDEKTTSKKSNRKGLIYELIFYVMLIFIMLYILPKYVIEQTVVDGTSMENTLMDGEHLFVEKVSYHFKEIERFDIIVFYPYGKENEEYYVKRIIGLPGERVQIIDNEIYINGTILEEDYGKDDWIEPGRAEAFIVLDEDEYFVMGDNREVSKDSRDSEVANVSKENIGGKVIFRIRPFNRFGAID